VKKLKSYRLRFPRFEHRAGTIVHELDGYDFGHAKHDSEIFNNQHVSVVLEHGSKTGFFTVPLASLEEIQTEDKPAKKSKKTA